MTGEFWAERAGNPDSGWTVRILRADPEIAISAELIERAARGELMTSIFELRCAGRHDPPFDHTGDTVVIIGANQRVIYQLTAYHWPGSYTGRWPD